MQREELAVGRASLVLFFFLKTLVIYDIIFLVSVFFFVARSCFLLFDALHDEPLHTVVQGRYLKHKILFY